MTKDKDFREKNAENIVGFRVFYGDGSNYFGKTLDDWKKAPKENVQLVLLYDKDEYEEGKNYRHTICGVDYYAFDGKSFTAGNDTRKLCSDYILYGKWMDIVEWKKITKEALNNYESVRE